MSDAKTLKGFAPVSKANARVLILGSMPGVESLNQARYYAHARNRFWPIMGELVGALPSLPYRQRLQRLTSAGIALWDVLDTCERPGSLDSAIRDHSAQANDFSAFLSAHRRIRTVLFNGGKAESSFQRLVLPTLDAFDLDYRRLPSTSPANASQNHAFKLAAWREALLSAGATLTT